MSRFRFSLSALFVVVAAVAMFCAALARPSWGWRTAAHAAELAGLFFSVLAVLFGKPTWRVFWGGFAAVGWGWLGLEKITHLPTEELSTEIAAIIYAPTTDEFAWSRQVLLWFWPLLFGLLAGIVADWLDTSGKARSKE